MDKAIEVITSVEHQLKVIYRALPIMLWSLEKRQLLESCSRLSSKHVDTSYGIMSAEPWLLAVAYWDGEVSLYDTTRRNRKCAVNSDS